MPPPDNAVEPPNCGDFSMTRGSRPDASAASAAVMPPPPDPTTSTSTVWSKESDIEHRRSDGEARDQFRRRAVEPMLCLVGSVGGQSRECRYPRADFVRGVAGLLLDPRVLPSVDLGEPVGVEQFQEGVVPVGVERLQRALPAGELARGLDHRDLPGLSLPGCHGIALPDPV